MLEAATQGDREKRMRHDGTIQPPDRGGRSTMQRLERRRQHNARIRRRAPLSPKSRARKEALERLRLCSEMLNEREGVATIDGLPNATPRQTAQSQMEAEPRPASSDPGCSRQRIRRRLHRHSQPAPPWSARWKTFGAARSGSIARTTRHPISPIPMRSHPGQRRAVADTISILAKRQSFHKTVTSTRNVPALSARS